VKVLFFAQSRGAAGCDHAEVKVDAPLTQAEFWRALIDLYPALVVHRKTARLARNETYLLEDELIQSGDEIAIIPPVSGG